MNNPVKYAVEPMFDTENSTQVLGYIVSKCLVKKNYTDFDEEGRRFHEVIFPFANHEDIDNYTYDPFEKGLRTRVINIYDDYDYAKLECNLANRMLFLKAIEGLEEEKALEYFKEAYEIQKEYFQGIEDIVLTDTNYLEIDKKAKTKRK